MSTYTLYNFLELQNSQFCWLTSTLRSKKDQQSLQEKAVTKTNIIVITFYSPSCLGQETAKGPFGLRVKLPPAHLSTTHGGGFTLVL